MNNLTNKKHINILNDLGIPYVDSFLKHPESLELFINHTFPMYESAEKFISFLQGGTFNESEIVNGLQKLSIIMDDFDVATGSEKKSLDSLVEFYNFFSLVNYKNSSYEISELNDKILYGVNSVNFMAGNYSVCEVGVDFDMMNSIVDIYRDILKMDIELIGNGVPSFSTLMSNDLKIICDSFPESYTLLKEKVFRIKDYMADLE
jgi:hypothetical protein